MVLEGLSIQKSWYLLIFLIYQSESPLFDKIKYTIFETMYVKFIVKYYKYIIHSSQSCWKLLTYWPKFILSQSWSELGPHHHNPLPHQSLSHNHIRFWSTRYTIYNIILVRYCLYFRRCLFTQYYLFDIIHDQSMLIIILIF